MNGDCTKATVVEKVRHVVGVTLGTAEAERPAAAVTLQLLKSVLRSSLGRKGLSKNGLIEPRTPPWNLGVIHIIRDTQITESRQELVLNAGDKVASVNEILLAQTQEVAAVHTVGGGCQTQKELRREVLDEAAIGPRRGMVKFVYDDVIEGVRRKLPKVGYASEGLDRSEKNIGVEVLLRLGRLVASNGLERALLRCSIV